MIQPNELKLNLPIEVGNGTISTTAKVWQILSATYKGDLQWVRSIVAECPDLVYAQYNYAPPIHIAVAEGHVDLVKYFLEKGAHDPGYKIYPFLEPLQVIANDRDFFEIEELLNEYASDKNRQKYSGDNGVIHYSRTPLQQEFEQAVDNNNVERTKQILKVHPEYALDETFCWSEGILLFPAKHNNREMIELLVSCGAKVPAILKWTQFYYFERLDGATFIMEKGMNPNTMNWQHVTILHDMAQKGFLDKAELLLNYGADINAVDQLYKSTPLGLAARWGQTEMVKYLLTAGADPDKAGATWASPLMWAKKKGFSEIVEILVQAGAK